MIPFSCEYHQRIPFLWEGECVMYTTVKLVKIEENRSITKENDPDFFFELQRGVLLSLKEEGMLTQMQYCNAEKALQNQRSDTHRKREGGSAS